jgi:nitrate reductase delta subunit
MRATLKALAALLLYPDEEMRALMPEVASILRAPGLPPAATEAAALAEMLAIAPPLEAEGRYVGLFDGVPSLSLHLFEHVHGDSRDRGAAMAALVEDYRAAGMELAAEELPDFLPVFLEFAAMRPEAEARDLEAVVARIAEDVPDATPEALDAAYEEAPVTFMEPAAPNQPCPKAAEIVARIEAAAPHRARGDAP